MDVGIIAPPWFTVPPRGYGGTEWIVSLLADGLVAAGHDVTLVAAEGSSTDARLVSPTGAARPDLRGDVCTEVRHALQGYRALRHADVIHDHSGWAGPALAAFGSVPPTVHTCHGAWTPENVPLYRDVCDRVGLVAISHDQAGRAPAGVRLAGVVHNAIPLHLYPVQDRKEDLLLYVGRSTPDKGPELAVEAARRLGQRLVMVMKVIEPDEVRHFEEVVRPGFDGVDVDLHTEITNEDKADLMGRARCVLFPIRWPEPFGLVPAEAMACGTPVVAFAEGAVPEVVAAGRTGRVVPPGDLDAFCAAIDEAAGLDPWECRRVVEDRFGRERMVAGYLDIYDRVAATSDPTEGAA